MIPGPRRHTDITKLVIFSDPHHGCQLGLCPPEGASLDEGGRYMPSRFQQKVWKWWKEAWTEWVPSVTKGERFAVLCNGDAIDGDHHRSVHQWTHNIKDQIQCAYKVISPVVDLCKGRYLHIRGTEAHVGQSGQHEEQLAERLGAIPDGEGQHARYEAWVRLGTVLVHALHHVGTTGSAAYESTAVHKEYTESVLAAAKAGLEPPQVIVRSHRHRHIQTSIGTARGPAIATVTPGWQGKTPFAWKIPGARISLPEFGLLCITVSDTKGKKVTESGDAPVRVLSWTRYLERGPEVQWPTEKRSASP